MNIYRLIALNGYAAYRNTMVGNPAPAVAEEGKRSRNPVPGDLVLETSSFSRPWWREDVSPGPALGILLRRTDEPISTQEQLDAMHAIDDCWKSPDERLSDIPTEDVWYIEPLDPTVVPREVRWTNCSFIHIHTEPQT